MSADLPVDNSGTYGCSAWQRTFILNAAIDGSEPKADIGAERSISYFGQILNFTGHAAINRHMPPPSLLVTSKNFAKVNVVISRLGNLPIINDCLSASEWRDHEEECA